MSEIRLGRAPEFLGVAVMLLLASGGSWPLEAASNSPGSTTAAAEAQPALPNAPDEKFAVTNSAIANNTNNSSRGVRAAAEKPLVKPSLGSNNSQISIAGVEKLIIKVQGYNAISGEHRVNENASIQVAGLGWINVKDKSLSEIEHYLSEEIEKLTGREAVVSVEVAEYKPIFVSGYVTKAGSFPWRPGYTVLHAETLSGGPYRPTAMGAALPSDTERARAHRGASDLANVEVMLARLQTERTDSKEIKRPANLKELVSDVDADRMMAAQATALASRRAAYEAQVQGLERARLLAQEEFQELRDEHARMKEQVKSRRDNLAKLEGLKDKGYLRAERILDEQGRVADLEGRSSSSSVALARVKSLLGTFQRDIDVLRQERIASIDSETIRLEREASQLEIEVQSATSSYRKLTGANAFNEAQSKQSMVGYEIVRAGQNGAPVAITANRFTLLEPGDVLVVNLIDQLNN